MGKEIDELPDIKPKMEVRTYVGLGELKELDPGTMVIIYTDDHSLCYPIIILNSTFYFLGTN